MAGDFFRCDFIVWAELVGCAMVFSTRLLVCDAVVVAIVFSALGRSSFPGFRIAAREPTFGFFFVSCAWAFFFRFVTFFPCGFLLPRVCRVWCGPFLPVAVILQRCEKLASFVTTTTATRRRGRRRFGCGFSGVHGDGRRWRRRGSLRR